LLPRKKTKGLLPTLKHSLVVFLVLTYDVLPDLQDVWSTISLLEKVFKMNWQVYNIAICGALFFHAGCTCADRDSQTASFTNGSNCDQSYPDVCISRYPPDLDCDEVGLRRFRVTGDDPHGFDRDNDGLGCE
jgi:hypothetical protein